MTGGARERTTFILAAAVVLLFPLVGLPRDDERASLPLELSYLYAADVALIALLLLTIPRLVRAALRTRTAEGASWLALFGLLVVAFVFHPSARGVDVLVRLAAAAALYRVVADLIPSRRRAIAAVLGLTAIVQAGIGVLQFATGAPLGLHALGEITEDLLTYGGPRALARGTLGHEFILAALALVSGATLAGEGIRGARPAGWIVSAGLGIVSAGLVYGRTAAIALIVTCASLVPGAVRGRRHRWALAALLLGAGIPALVAYEGWTSSFGRGAGTDRGAMVEQALAIVATAPLVGVGPGNYLDALRSRPELHVTREPQNVHDVPVMLAAEAGVPAGVIAAALLVLIGSSGLRAGVPAITLYLAYVPWMLLDVLPYVTPQGLVLTALWLAFLRAYRRGAGTDVTVLRPRAAPRAPRRGAQARPGA